MSLLYDMGNVKESIQDNPSSETLFKATDWTLYNAVELLLQHTNLMEEVLAIYANTYTRKRITNASPKEFIQLVHYFFNGPEQDRLATIQKMKLNRELIRLPVEMVADVCKDYCNAFVTGSQMEWQLRKKLLVKGDREASHLFIQVKFWHDRYLEMVKAISEKYYRLVVHDIGKHSYVIPQRLDKDDMGVEYALSIFKAFAKYDVSSGPFTSYLKHWFKSARSHSMSNDEMGLAFILQPNVRNKLGKGQGYSNIHNFIVDSDTISEAVVNVLEDMETLDEHRAFLQLASIADPSGIYRILHEIEIMPEEIAVKIRCAS